MTVRRAVAQMVLLVAGLSAQPGAATTDCPGMDADAILSVTGKREIENHIEAEIRVRLRMGTIDWGCLVQDFREAGPRATVEVLRDGAGLTVYRFSVDRRGDPWHFYFPAPGASNGLYTAIASRHDDGRIEIIRRGGRREAIGREIPGTSSER